VLFRLLLFFLKFLELNLLLGLQFLIILLLFFLKFLELNLLLGLQFLIIGLSLFLLICSNQSLFIFIIWSYIPLHCSWTIALLLFLSEIC